MLTFLAVSFPFAKTCGFVAALRSAAVLREELLKRPKMAVFKWYLFWQMESNRNNNHELKKKVRNSQVKLVYVDELVQLEFGDSQLLSGTRLCKC